MSLNQTCLALGEIQDYLNTRLKHAQSERWDRALDAAVSNMTGLEGVMVTAAAGEQDVDEGGMG